MAVSRINEVVVGRDSTETEGRSKHLEKIFSQFNSSVSNSNSS